jgi:hypothetical protein
MQDTYEEALEALDQSFVRLLTTADAARAAGTTPHPPPEVVAIAHACEAVRWRVNPGEKSSEERHRRRLAGQLDDLLQIAKSRFAPAS